MSDHRGDGAGPPGAGQAQRAGGDEARGGEPGADPTWRQQKGQREDDAVKDQLLRILVRQQGGQELRQDRDQAGAEELPRRRSEAAEEDDHQHRDRLGHIERGGADRAGEVDGKRAGQAGQRARQRIGQPLHGDRRDGEGSGGDFVGADRGEGAAGCTAGQPANQKDRQRGDREHEVEIGEGTDEEAQHRQVAKPRGWQVRQRGFAR